MSYSNDFKLYPHVRRVYEDIKSAWTQSKKTVSDLETAIDQTNSREVNYVSHDQSNQILESRQVLAFCYAHESCYPILKKHGYPVTVPLADSDPQLESLFPKSFNGLIF